jgi:hypothetical protein
MTTVELQTKLTEFKTWNFIDASSNGRIKIAELAVSDSKGATVS